MRRGLGVALLLATLSMARPSDAAETVTLPMTLEYPLIRSLLIEQLYSAPGRRAVVVDDDQAECLHIELSNPEVGRELSRIKVGTDITISAGAPVLGTCRGRIEWKGYIEVLHRPVLDEKKWEVRFQATDSRVFSPNRKPVKIASTLWDLIKVHVHPYLSQASIELAPPLQEIRDFLPVLFLPRERLRVHRWLDTLRLGEVQVEEDAVKVGVLMEAQTASGPPESAAPLSPSDIERLSRLWEDWDSLLVLEIESLLGQPVTDAERKSLLEILLKNRHEFLLALDRNSIGPDLVRRQFTDSWQRLARILRKYLVRQQSRPPLSYLAFFAASDALAALDRVGPALGLEISRDGLVRLARLLSAGDTDPPLSYSYAVDPMLRASLGLGPPLDESGPASELEELGLPGDSPGGAGQGGSRSRLHRILFPEAWAAENAPTVFDQVKEWIPPAENPGRYIDKVRDLLDAEADKVLAGDPRLGEYGPFFRSLLRATVWQESCWRQFNIRNGRIRYLVSYNRSSTGLMQINERVWRGIYRVESLRWNIAYNAKAGTEILHLYLRNYAFREIKPGTPADLDAAARLTYAIYNGGPAQVDHYFERRRAGAFYRSDLLFWEKYRFVKEGKFHHLLDCVAGR